MKTVFVEVEQDRDWAVASLGPAFIAPMLRRRGHTAELYTAPRDGAIDAIARAILALSPDLVGLSLTSRQWQRGRRIVAALRSRSDVPVIAGGLHPTFSADEVLRNPGFDYVCLGEGELAMVELADALERGVEISDGMIPNLQLTPGIRPALRPPFEPLDDLPFMARDMLNERHGVFNITTQRGCPFPCTYCAARKYHDLYDGVGDYGRRRSHESVMQEIRELKEQGLSYIIFLDDTFTLDPKWVKRFCELNKAEGGTPFSLHARVETINPRMLRQLADAGCRHITYGVESGSLRVRREVMKRRCSNTYIQRAFEQTREVGIIVTANYILGSPGETREDLEMTLAFHEQLRPDDFGYFVFYPYPGTALFQLCKERGYLPDDYLDRPANHRESILNMPDLSKADIAEFYDRFTAARERGYLERHGANLSDSARAEVSKLMTHCASTG